jgi:hypothetical protein
VVVARGGRSGERRRCGCGRGQNYTGARTAAKSGLYAALGNNVFDYGHRAATDQMRTSWEKLVQFVGTNYGQDISNELQCKYQFSVINGISNHTNLLVCISIMKAKIKMTHLTAKQT